MSFTRKSFFAVAELCAAGTLVLDYTETAVRLSFVPAIDSATVIVLR